MHFKIETTKRQHDQAQVVAFKVGVKQRTLVLRKDSTYSEVATDLRRLADWVASQAP